MYLLLIIYVIKVINVILLPWLLLGWVTSKNASAVAATLFNKGTIRISLDYLFLVSNDWIDAFLLSLDYNKCRLAVGTRPYLFLELVYNLITIVTTLQYRPLYKLSSRRELIIHCPCSVLHSVTRLTSWIACLFGPKSEDVLESRYCITTDPLILWVYI